MNFIKLYTKVKNAFVSLCNVYTLKAIIVTVGLVLFAQGLVLHIQTFNFIETSRKENIMLAGFVLGELDKTKDELEAVIAKYEIDTLKH